MIDTDSNNILVQIDAELEPIVPDFLDYRRKDIAAVRTALADNDFAIIARIGHNIKGSGGGYGFDRISDIGERLEFAAETHDCQSVSALIDDLESYLDKVEIIYA